MATDDCTSLTDAVLEKYLIPSEFAGVVGVGLKRAQAVLKSAYEQGTWYRGIPLLVRRENGSYQCAYSSIKQLLPTDEEAESQLLVGGNVLQFPVGRSAISRDDYISATLTYPFIDYISVYQYFPAAKKIYGGYLEIFDEAGQFEFRTYKPSKLEGSYLTSLRVRSDGHRVELGRNVGAFGRRDNIFNYGLKDTLQIVNNLTDQLELPRFESGEEMEKSYRKQLSGYFCEKFPKRKEVILRQLATFADNVVVESDRWGNLNLAYVRRYWTGARITRLDLTYNYSLGSYETLLKYLRIQEFLRIQRNSVTWGSGLDDGYSLPTKYVTPKIYNKAVELEVHKKSDPQTIQWCRDVGLLRHEITCHSRFLRQNGLYFLGDLMKKEHKLAQIYEKNARKMLTPCTLPSAGNSYLGLSKVEFATFRDWKDGVDVSRSLNDRTFRRHRKAILEKSGFDIKLMAPLGVLDDMKQIVVHIEPLSQVPDWYELLKPKKVEVSKK